jgi:FkbM family methyltransferase
MFARSVKSAARRIGLEIRHHRPFSRRRMNRMREAGVATVIDVGANAGQYGRELREAGYKGTIVSLEPLPSAFVDLERAAAKDGLWQCLNVAAGVEEARLPLNVASNRASSSLLSMTDAHTAGAPTVGMVGHEVVTVRPLDDLGLSIVPPVLLKLDVQGYEAQVLAGAQATLAHTSLVECELVLEPLYDGQAPLGQMVSILAGLGFALVDLDPFFYDVSDGSVLALDGLFVRQDGSQK